MHHWDHDSNFNARQQLVFLTADVVKPGFCLSVMEGCFLFTLYLYNSFSFFNPFSAYRDFMTSTLLGVFQYQLHLSLHSSLLCLYSFYQSYLRTSTLSSGMFPGQIPPVLAGSWEFKPILTILINPYGKLNGRSQDVSIHAIKNHLKTQYGNCDINIKTLVP